MKKENGGSSRVEVTMYSFFSPFLYWLFFVPLLHIHDLCCGKSKMLSSHNPEEVII
jgi:hypothetical protein